MSTGRDGYDPDEDDSNLTRSCVTGCEPESSMSAATTYLTDDQAPKRPTEEAARAAIEAWLGKHAAGYPTYSLCEDGDDVWAFWIAYDDTTSYLSSDMRIQWAGTGWPDDYAYNGDTGAWSPVSVAATGAAA